MQFGPLGLTLVRQMMTNPGFVPQILGHVGLFPLLDWTRHYLALGWYSGLYRLSKPLDAAVSSQLTPSLRFHWKRILEAWEFGSGSDYKM